MIRSNATHSLSKFLRAEAEGAPQALPEIPSNPRKPDMELVTKLYNRFWIAAIRVTPAERTERLTRLGLALIEEYRAEEREFRVLVETLRKMAEVYELYHLRLVQGAQCLEYENQSTEMLAQIKRVKEYQAAALLMRAMAWFLYEYYENPHFKG